MLFQLLFQPAFPTASLAVASFFIFSLLQAQPLKRLISFNRSPPDSKWVSSAMSGETGSGRRRCCILLRKATLFNRTWAAVENGRGGDTKDQIKSLSDLIP